MLFLRGGLLSHSFGGSRPDLIELIRLQTEREKKQLSGLKYGSEIKEIDYHMHTLVLVGLGLYHS